MMIIDTHTHFYDPTRPKGVPWPSPTDELLYRPVLPEHYKALAIPKGVTGTVVVEASSWFEDNQWVLDLAADEPFIVGFVGNLDLASDSFAASLARLAHNPLFRGIRVGRNAVTKENHQKSLPHLSRLASHSLSLDLLIGPDSLPGVLWLAGSLPGLRIIINHIAGVRVDGNTPDAGWSDHMRQIGKYPNVFCKVSGLVEATGLRPAPADVAFYAPTLDVLWETLGEDRLIYASNWPVSERFADYATVQGIITGYFSGKGDVALEKCLWRNSQRAYRWIERQ